MEKQTKLEIGESKPLSESKQKIKTMGKEFGLTVIEGVTFSLKTIRDGLRWAHSSDEEPKKAVPKKKVKKNGVQVIVVR